MSALAAACGCAVAPVAMAGAAAEPLEYLYIEANEDGASGGHVALRLGDRVHHFERDAEGRLRLARVDWPRFSFRYRVAMNRGVRANPIDASAQEVDALRASLDARFRAERDDFARLDALRGDAELLEARAAGEPLPLRGAGFFELARRGAGIGEREAGGTAPPSLRVLAREIEDAHGFGLLAALAREAEARLHALPHGLASARSFPLTEMDVKDRVKAGALEGVGLRMREAAELRVALGLLEAPSFPLRDSALLRLAELPPLSPEEARQLRRRSSSLRAALVRLVVSPRPDRGFPLLLGMARLAAADATLATGVWTIVDPLPANAVVFRAGEVARSRAPLARLARLQRAHTRAWRERMQDANEWSELEQGDFEGALARWHALDAALTKGSALRARTGKLVPRAIAAWQAPPLREPERRTVQLLARRARERLREAEVQLDARHGYALLTRNCVTELFELVEAAAPEAPLARRALSDGALAFWPLAAERAVRATNGGAFRTLESHRRTQLAAMREREAGWRVALRESNVLSSTLFEASPATSSFLFYTDDAALTRPLRGAANLAVGLLQATLGLLSAPVDGGARLADGVRGVVMSAPELVFVNLRKGSYPFAVAPEGLRD